MMVAGHFSALLQHRWDGAISRPVLGIQTSMWVKKCTMHQQRPCLEKGTNMVPSQMPALPPSRAHQHAAFVMLNRKG